jgi:ATP synthase protein I
MPPTDNNPDSNPESGPAAGKGGLNDLVKAESMIQLGIMLPAACFIGWLAGTWVDHHFGTSWAAIAGVLLGAVAGFIQIFRIASTYLNRGPR